MAHDQREAWGLIHHTHIHHTRRLEYRGCTVESFRTLAARDARDAWHGRDES